MAELKTPKEWQVVTGVVVMDPDGWRSKCGKHEPRDFNDPITQEEFEDRLSISTIMCPPTYFQNLDKKAE